MYIKQVVGMGIEKKNWVSFLCTSNKAFGMSG
jgi:hypothetical protein